MAIKATYKKYILEFKTASGTSRGVMTTKETWFIFLENQGKTGIGECGILRTLSIDDRPDYEDKLKWVCENISLGVEQLWQELLEFPSIQFGVEMAFLSLQSQNKFELFPSKFTSGVAKMKINGLIWMGEAAYMKSQIEQKIAAGFDCIKLKIGAIDFAKELELLAFIRHHFEPSIIEIRVDANGAFHSNEALDKLNQLAGFQLHSIEQPITKNNTDKMAELCKITPIPIALDEELIGVFSKAEKEKVLAKIKPQYIILKPSLIGGFKGTLEWIAIAEQFHIKWWITSALESNIGLNAITQFTYTLQNNLPQGLGTGGLYTNNFDCPLYIDKGHIVHDNSKNWELKNLGL